MALSRLRTHAMMTSHVTARGAAALRCAPLVNKAKCPVICCTTTLPQLARGTLTSMLRRAPALLVTPRGVSLRLRAAAGDFEQPAAAPGFKPAATSSLLSNQKSLDEQARWEENLEKLRAYSVAHGTTDVSKASDDPAIVALANWVQRQRTKRRKGELQTRRAAALDAIGFVWEPLAGKWENSFAAYVEHQRANKPLGYLLVQWAHDQRLLLEKGKLDASRKARLDAAGFAWTPLDSRWEEMFAQLQQYAATHDGSTAVPHVYKPNPSLGLWVHRQRARKEEMSSQRRARLESINFQWAG